jgi:hypothetical protein
MILEILDFDRYAPLNIAIKEIEIRVPGLGDPDPNLIMGGTSISHASVGQALAAWRLVTATKVKKSNL